MKLKGRDHPDCQACQASLLRRLFHNCKYKAVESGCGWPFAQQEGDPLYRLTPTAAKWITKCLVEVSWSIQVPRAAWQAMQTPYDVDKTGQSCP